jgi:S-methylmethionine-dependent homocysteine/selenocysteine methylase
MSTDDAQLSRAPLSLQRQSITPALKANASPLSPEELDKLNHLAATDCQTWARDELACAREFDLTILGGCCGTDQRYIEALANGGSIEVKRPYLTRSCQKMSQF